MTVGDFEASAEAVASVIAEPELGVGQRILESVRRTRAAVGINTNLGIVLLAAPLAQAAMATGGGGLRDRLAAVLAGLDVGDAELAFEAIRLAAPAGLGSSERHDVRASATATLRQAMAEAQDRDLIARQYATDFEDVFEHGLRWYRQALARWQDQPWAASRTYLGFLARFPDSHVARKFGRDRAEELRRRAELVATRLLASADPAPMTGALLDFDAALKAERLNPGTSADLTVATLFAARLEDAIAEGGQDR